MSRKELEKDFKRNLIADAAQQLFSSNLFEKVTVEDIAKESEFGKGTLYQYFENKEDILVFIICRGIDEVCEDIKTYCLEEEDVNKSIEELIRVYYEFLQVYRNLFVSFVRWQLDGSLPVHMVAKVNEVHQNKIELMNKVVERGVKEGVLIDVDSRLLVRAIESSINGFNLPFLAEDVSGSEEHVKFFKQVLFKGILKHNT